MIWVSWRWNNTENMEAIPLSPDSKLRAYAPLFAILAVFLLAEILVFRTHRFPFCDWETDGIGYMQRASGPLFRVHPFHPPGYAIAIRAVGGLLGISLFTAGKTLSLISAMGFVVCGWLVFRATVGYREAVAATALLAAVWLNLLYGVTVLSDMPGAVLFMGSLAALLVPEKACWKHFLVAGLLAGCAYLTRYMFIFLVSLPFVFQALMWRRNDSLKALPWNTGAFFLAFLIPTLPWFVFLAGEKGDPFWSESHLVLAQHIYGDEAEDLYPKLRGQFQSSGDVILNDPLLFLSSWWDMVCDLPKRFRSSFPGFYLVAPLGLVFWLRSCPPKKRAFLAMSGLYVSLAAMIHFEGRYFIPITPILASVVAAGLVGAPEFFTNRRPFEQLGSLARSLAPIFVVVCYLALMARGAKSSIEYVFAQEEAEEYRLAAEFLSGRIEINEPIGAAKPHVPYYCGGEFHSFSRQLHLGDRDASDLPQTLAESPIAYLVYDERIGAARWSEYAFLLDPETQPYADLLEPVFVCESPKKLVVYRIANKP